MKLKEFFKKNSTNLAKFCREKGLSQYTVRQLLEGKDCYLSSAIALEKATEGKVTVYEIFADIKKPRRKLIRISTI